MALFKLLQIAKPKDISYILKIYMCTQKLFNPIISPKYPDMQTLYCKRLLTMHRTSKNNPACWRNSTNGVWHHNVHRFSCLKWSNGTTKLSKHYMFQGQRNVFIGKAIPTQLAQVSSQNIPVKPYSLPTTVTQTVTASYIVLQSSLLIILKELEKAKQMNLQLRKYVQMT